MTTPRYNTDCLQRRYLSIGLGPYPLASPAWQESRAWENDQGGEREPKRWVGVVKLSHTHFCTTTGSRAASVEVATLESRGTH